MSCFSVPRLCCLNILLLGCAVVTACADDKEAAEKPQRVDWAHVKLSGSYAESQQMPGLFGDLTESLPVCLDRLRQAAEDKGIRGVILEIDGVATGWGKLHEIQTAIKAIRSTGKPVWARMTDVSTKDYLLAVTCDRILVPESATLMLTGLRAEVTFYKNLFDKLNVKADMLRVGAFKSAAEPYTRSEMSPEFRHEMEQLLDDYFQMILSQVAEGRGISMEAAEAAIDRGLLPAADARDLGLVDDLAYADQIPDLIQGGENLDVRIRTDYRKSRPNTDLDLFSMMNLLSGGSSRAPNTRPRIAVLRAEGMIVKESMPTSLFGESMISSDKLVPLIEKLGKDKNVRAIVLRVDSPGGSALASDLIWRALNTADKPFVVSMGDTAASGGYYISMGADRIFVEPGTLTGSIGVLGGKISFRGLMEKVGVTMSVIRRGKNSGVMSMTEAFTDSERDAMQNMLDTIYRQFTEKAAAGRGMKYEDLEKLARGRVYVGNRALEIGLVDEVGTLADAIAHARSLVNDDEQKLELEDLPKPQSPLEMLLGQMDMAHGRKASAELFSLLPMEIQPVAKHWHVLRQLSTEPMLTLMPFSVVIE